MTTAVNPNCQRCHGSGRVPVYFDPRTSRWIYGPCNC